MLGFSCRKLGPISFVRKPRVSLATFQTLPAWRIGVRASAAHTCMTTPLGPPRSRRPPAPGPSRKPEPQAFTLLDSAGRGPVQLPGSSKTSFGVAKTPGAGTDIREVGLETTRTSKTYRLRLHQALALLLHWVSLSVWASVEWWVCPSAANQVLCEFVEWQHASGSSISHSRHSILAVQTAFRELKGKLGRSWECLQSWQLKLPLKSRRPISDLLVNAMFLVGIAQGMLCGPRALDFWSSAVLVRVGFHCLLRPGEICKLIVEDLHFPQTAWDAQVCVIRFRDPKNRSSLGRFQFALVRDISIVRWLRWLKDGCDPQTKLWPGSSTKFAKAFKQLLCLLGLERLDFTAGSLRPGGATKAFVEGMSIANLKYLGRWRVEHSLETYIQEAMCQLMSSRLTECEQSAIHHLLADCSDQLDSPPLQHWSTFCSRTAQWRGRQATLSLRSSSRITSR